MAYTREPPRHARIGDICIDVSVMESHAASAEVSEHPVEEGSVIADHIRPEPRTIEIEGLVTNHPIEPPQSHTGSAVQSFDKLAIVAAPLVRPRIGPTSQSIEGERGLGGYEAIGATGQPLAVLGALKLDVRTKRRFAAEVYNVNPAATTTYALQALHFSQPFNRVHEVHAALLRIVDESQLVRVVTALATYNNVALVSLHIERSGELGRDQLRFTATGRVLRLVTTETVTLPPKANATKARGKQAAPVVPTSTLPVTPPENNDSLGYSEGGLVGLMSGGDEAP